MAFPTVSSPSPQRLLRWVELILAIALALALAEFAWRLWPGQAGGAAGRNSADPGGRAASTAPPGGARLSPAVFSLFGESPMAPAGAPVFEAAEDVPETGLDLALKGVLAQHGTNRKLALIAQGGDQEQVYWLGDVIADAKIVRIDARRVVLLRNGAREALTLEAEKLQALPAAVPRDAGRGQGGITRINDYQRVVTRDLLDRQLGNLSGLLQQAKAVPYVDNGRQLGFQMVKIKPGSVFEDLGLQQEDVIVAVNGVSVRNNREALAAYRQFRSAAAFQLLLLRGGREVTMDFSIQ